MASDCPNITEVSALQANSNNIVRSAQHGNSSTLNIPLSSLLSTSVIVLVTVSQLFFKCQHPFFFFFLVQTLDQVIEPEQETPKQYVKRP